MNREEAIRLIGWLKCTTNREDDLEAIDMAIEALSERPTDEWCTDCKEYDHEKHCCPRFNRVIRTTLNEVVLCKDCRWYRDTFLDTKITPTCDRHIDDRYGTLVGGVTGESFCSYGERREPLPQYEEWQDEFNKMCESARPTTFVADEWYRENFGENNGK